MSIRAKLTGACDALLLTVIGTFQIGLLIAIGSVASLQAAPVSHDPITVDSAHVEVVVVQATKISRG
jgi:hypothetical protein